MVLQEILKYTILFILLFQTLLFGQDTKSFSIEMLNERNYPMTIDTNGIYHITIDNKTQSIFKMKGITNDNEGYHKITWKTKNKYSWSDGMATDYYPVVNPASYTKDGVGYSMAGFMPEMKNSSVVIYGHYYSLTDSVVIHIQ